MCTPEISVACAASDACCAATVISPFASAAEAGADMARLAATDTAAITQIFADMELLLQAKRPHDRLALCPHRGPYDSANAGPSRAGYSGRVGPATS